MSLGRVEILEFEMPHVEAHEGWIIVNRDGDPVITDAGMLLLTSPPNAMTLDPEERVLKILYTVIGEERVGRRHAVRRPNISWCKS